MSAEEEKPLHNEDNYDAAYTSDAPEAPVRPATPEHGYWRSLRELDGKATLQTDRGNNEFPPAPDTHDPMSRRNFFQLMGASMALAGVATGCRRYEKEEIVPLGRRPEDQTPGQTKQYATAFELGGVGQALFATSYEGRPIKIDGNPVHPFASGGIVPGTQSHAGASTFAQASILMMYDPDRSESLVQAGKPSTMEAFKAALPQLRGNLGSLRILSEASSSPTFRSLKDKLTAQGVRWHEYEPISFDNERMGMKAAFGKYVRPIASLDRAETIVVIDGDIFVEHPASPRYNRDFARSRRMNGTLGLGKMNRLWAIESTFSNTGAMADHRLALRSELGLPFALALDSMLGGASGAPPAEFLKETRVKKFMDVLVAELTRNKKKAVVIAGRRQPPEVHALVARINQSIEAVGNTLDYFEDPEQERQTHVASITTLAKEMASGQVQTLVILGGNPVYDAPADLDFAGALAKVGTSVHLHEYVNETGAKTTWHVPRAHYLESWGDTRTWDGTVTLAQPLIAPLYGGVSAIEMLAMILGEEKPGLELVRGANAAAGVDLVWNESVHDGFIRNTGLPKAEGLTTGNFAIPELSPTQRSGTNPKQDVLEVTFHFSSHSYDGRYANNAWLQETPDFLTKVTWDNYAIVNPDTADAFGLANDTMMKVKVGEREVEIACYTMAGQARNSIALVLGGGRTMAGRVGGSDKDARRVGWNVHKVRSSTGFDYALGAKVSSTGSKYELASTQEHQDIRTGLSPSVNSEGLQERLFDLVKEVRADVLTAKPTWHAEEPEAFWDDERMGPEGAKRHLSLFKEKEYLGHRWGMAIDLTTCTGCNACMVACQSENNVPVVGRKEVINNREMHWIRIDRYFSGSRDEPEIVYQPVACQQCENAPCEQVCPVGATSHSDEGLNDQAYNRCIGTRYCANNCPYKVRKFNFLDWNKEWREARNKVRRLLFNPDVTVRMRGVMEKCTFCVQRIQNAKIHARAQIRNPTPTSARSLNSESPPDGIEDGEIETACQQACPTEAIVFGDLADKSSRVSKLHEDRRQYALLPETYTKPRNRFLARIRNLNKDLVPVPADPHAAKPAGGHE